MQIHYLHIQPLRKINEFVRNRFPRLKFTLKMAPSRVLLGTAGPSVTKARGQRFSRFTADERIVLAESVLPYLSPSDRQPARTRQPATTDLQLYAADGKPVDLAYKPRALRYA
jgi:hypothetical protein